MKEPRDESILSARLARAYASLSPYSAARLAEDLCRIERAQRKHAERCCLGADGGYVRQKRTIGGSGLWECRDCLGSPMPPIERIRHVGHRMVPCLQHDPQAEERAGDRIKDRLASWRGRLIEAAYGIGLTDLDPMSQRRRWAEHHVELQGDPRGAVLLIRLPGEAEATRNPKRS